MLGELFKALVPTHAATSYQFKHDGLIHFAEARRGKGKSYTLTAFTLAAAAKRLPVVTNTQSVDFYRVAVRLCSEGHFESLLEALEWLRDNVRFAREWDDLLTAYDSVVLLDEVTRLFEARAGFSAQKTPPVVYEWFQQSRKAKCTVWLAGQSFEWLDKKIAQLVDLLWLTRREDDKRSGLPAAIWLYGLDPGGAGKTDNVKRNMADFKLRLPFRLDIARLYNSWEMIHLLRGEPSFMTVGDISRWHQERGVIIEADMRERLEQQIARLESAVPEMGLR